MSRSPATQSALALTPVRERVTVGDQVHALLRSALLTGRFEPGSLLTISALADSFGTSQMPVREALRRLSTEGAVDMRANGSCYVPAATPARLKDLVELRILLEHFGTQRAAETMDDAALAALESLVNAHAALSATWQAEEMLHANYDFHFTIYRAARSPSLIPLIDSLWLQYGPFMRLLSDHISAGAFLQTHRQFIEGHRHIVASLRARDGEAAADAVVEDIRQTHDLLKDLCSA